jgi:hypothetical protein
LDALLDALVDALMDALMDASTDALLVASPQVLGKLCFCFDENIHVAVFGGFCEAFT